MSNCIKGFPIDCLLVDTVAISRYRIEELETQLSTQTARADAAEGLHVYLYNSGYMAGHDATVEGCFTDIHQSDMKTYHADVVKDILEDKP